MTKCHCQADSLVVGVSLILRICDTQTYRCRTVPPDFPAVEDLNNDDEGASVWSCRHQRRGDRSGRRRSGQRQSITQNSTPLRAHVVETKAAFRCMIPFNAAFPARGSGEPRRRTRGRTAASSSGHHRATSPSTSGPIYSVLRRNQGQLHPKLCPVCRILRCAER